MKYPRKPKMGQNPPRIVRGTSESFTGPAMNASIVPVYAITHSPVRSACTTILYLHVADHLQWWPRRTRDNCKDMHVYHTEGLTSIIRYLSTEHAMSTDMVSTSQCPFAKYDEWSSKSRSTTLVHCLFVGLCLAPASVHAPIVFPLTCRDYTTKHVT